MSLHGVLEAAGALKPGHTQFRSGGHADGWVEKGQIIHDAARLDDLAAAQARQIQQAFPTADLLVGAPACGAVLASFIARHLRLPVAYVLADAGPQWHRMHVPGAGRQVVYVDDLICTGTGAKDVLGFLKRDGHHVLGISAWSSRVPLPDLVTLGPPPFRTFPAGTCPQCRAGAPLRWVDVRE